VGYRAFQNIWFSLAASIAVPDTGVRTMVQYCRTQSLRYMKSTFPGTLLLSAVEDIVIN